MRQHRMWIVFFLAMTSGGLAAYLTLRYLRDQKALIAAEPKGASVIVAARDLSVGTIVRAADVRLARWPGHATPPGYLGTVEAAVGRGVITPVRANEPLLEEIGRASCRERVWGAVAGGWREENRCMWGERQAEAVGSACV